MYSRFQLAKKYLHYYLTASNGKGHGIHSPFVFDFVIYVLNKTKDSNSFNNIEEIRKQLLHDGRIIEVEDFGAGSSVMRSKKRKIKDIAHTSLKQKKFARLIAEVANYYAAKTIIELGTSLGITTSYIANKNPDAIIYTLEGSKEIAAIAEENFKRSGLKNIELIKGNFDETLVKILDKIHPPDLAFIDGNHRKEPTIRYFKILLQHLNSSSILIFDDIHWSAEMEEAWKFIKDDPSVTLSIDLFFIGLVFFRPSFKIKQHFVIRF